MSKICNRCGATFNPDDTKCRYCGASVSNSAVDEASVYRNMMPVKPVMPKTNGGNTSAMPPKASSNVTFTPNVRVSQPATTSSKQNNHCSIFGNSQWERVWADKRSKASALGIILTNTQDLADPSEFLNTLNSYLDFKLADGVEYCLLDLKDQVICRLASYDIESVIDLLCSVYDVAVPDYLMIVGDDTVIPRAEWCNEIADDPDEFVPSDLPYITFDTESPWEGIYFDFDDVTKVGRIPAKAQNNFAEAIAYFNNTAKFRPYTTTRAFAYSAKSWELTSKNIFAHLGTPVLFSPEYTCDPDYVNNPNYKKLNKLSSEYNLLCVNLHGSDTDHFWWGEDNRRFNKAFEKSLLPTNNGYAVMVEACYGARSSASDSIVVNAIKNNCIAFVGSSMIAYGAGGGGASCADIVARSFSKSLMRGDTAGDAFIGALRELVSDDYLYESEIKTLAEFALYGDPSAVLISKTMSHESARGSRRAKRSATHSDKTRAVKLIPCNEKASSNGRNGNMSLQSSLSPEMQSKLLLEANRIMNVSSGVMLESFSDMANEQPSVYKLAGKEEYRAVYTKQVSGFKSIVSMHIDKEGKVNRIYCSK